MRLLLIAEVAFGPPYMGNRKRLQTLVKEMRQNGIEVHFAGIQIGDAEKAASLPLVDAWVHDFWPERPEDANWPRKSGVLSRAAGELAWRLGLGGPAGNHQRVDDFVCDSWLGEAADLQRRYAYDAVMVPYAYRSRLLLAFPDPCHRIMEAPDVFTDRARKLRDVGARNIWFSCSRNEERKALLRAHTILAIQSREAAFLGRLVGEIGRVCTVGHICETKPLPDPTRPRIGYVASNNPLNIAGMNWFMREVWPLVLQACPDAVLEIIGDAGGDMHQAKGIVQAGRVPSIETAHENFLFTINPMPAGTGLKIKTVESLAYGRPVVATTAAAEGLESFVGNGLLVADTASAFAGAVASLWRDRAMAGRLGTAAAASMAEYVDTSRRELRKALAGGPS